MKAAKQVSLLALAVIIVTLGGAYSCQAHGQAVTEKSSSDQKSGNERWSIQVNKVDPGDVNLTPEFRIAIYESLLSELTKTKQFERVIRDGDSDGAAVSDLLILKTTVEKYTAGSETRRAVTTVSGATKLTVRSQLCARDGKVVLERTVDGNVRFMGGNLKATHNLARNVAGDIKKSTLPAPSPTTSAQGNQESVASTETH